jgi:hypothetical protein
VANSCLRKRFKVPAMAAEGDSASVT